MFDRSSLAELAAHALGGRKLVLASHRQPFAHLRDGGAVRIAQGVGGVATALNSVMRATGGSWVALGHSDEDRAAADEKGRLRMPPGESSYTLRRIFAPADVVERHYRFANAALWPLCHIAYETPVFDLSDWEGYVALNLWFAEAILEEAGDDGVVFVQDYQLALVPSMVKAYRPGLPVAQFWHIPWPNPEAFRICPWKLELLHGLLANDLLGFHIQHHVNNFLETCDRELEARRDHEQSAIVERGRSTFVRPFPISPDFEEIGRLAETPQVRDAAQAHRRRFSFEGRPIVSAVDRVDYTKGILERLEAFDLYLTRQLGPPAVLVQVGVPTRVQVERFRAVRAEVELRIARLRERHGPVVHYVGEALDFPEVVALYLASDAVWVASRHDGMNLVAKEFVAARTDGDGVLLLSRWTGAARELQESVLVNPYDTDGMARALAGALTMDADERRRRMAILRERMRAHTVFDWSAAILQRIARIASGIPGGAIGADAWTAPNF